MIWCCADLFRWFVVWFGCLLLWLVVAGCTDLVCFGFGLGLLGCVLVAAGLVGYYLFWVLVGGCVCCLLGIVVVC